MGPTHVLVHEMWMDGKGLRWNVVICWPIKIETWSCGMALKIRHKEMVVDCMSENAWGNLWL